MIKVILILIFLCVFAGCDKHCFNKTMAIEQLTQCANHGDASAQYNLGVNYEQGRSIPQDDKEAAKWYLKAAKQNNSDAQYNLGLKYEQGKGVPQNDKKAFEWISKAAAQNHVVAQYKLGEIYRIGNLGVPQDDQKAFEWYSKAAENDFIAAQYALGSLYHDGRGVPQNHAKALEWYSKAAEQGDANAQYHIALMYNKGEGVVGQGTEQAALLAVMWLNLSAAQNNDAAIKLRSMLIKKMTLTQIAASKKMTDDWLSAHNQPKNITIDEGKAE